MTTIFGVVSNRAETERTGAKFLMKVVQCDWYLYLRRDVNNF